MFEITLEQNTELRKFDQLRAILKNKMHKKKKKPTLLDKEQYKKLTSVLNTMVIANKLDLKQKVKCYEKEFYKAQGTFPNQENNSEYKE